MDDLDNVMDVLDAMEAKKKGETREQAAATEKVRIGEVDRYFDHVSVAAIKLSERLAVGDTIEIENDDYTVRQKVSSMQINRKDVDEAAAGDDVGIKVSVPVRRGSGVFRL